MAFETFVYTGMTDLQKDAWLKAMQSRANFDYPNTARGEYVLKRKDSPADIARKEARRAEFLKQHKADTKSRLVDLDNVKEVAGVVLKKGVPLKVDMEDPDIDSEKLMGLAKLGVLEIASEKQAKVKAAPSASPFVSGEGAQTRPDTKPKKRASAKYKE